MSNDLKIYAKTIEPEALNQIYNLITQKPFINQRIRIMPDVHYGVGCVVGFTSTMTDMVIPSVIGVDIGCGMLVTELGNIDIDLEKLDLFIHNNIPCGPRVHKESLCRGMLKKLNCFSKLRDLEKLDGSLGTLGGGNHFIGATRF